MLGNEYALENIFVLPEKITRALLRAWNAETRILLVPTVDFGVRMPESGVNAVSDATNNGVISGLFPERRCEIPEKRMILVAGRETIEFKPGTSCDLRRVGFWELM